MTNFKLPEFPPRGSGLEQLGKLVKRANDYYTSQNRKTAENKYRFQIKDPIETLKNSVQSLSKGLTDALGQITGKSESIDYNGIVKSFLPINARLLTPGNPRGAQELLYADVDGDGRDEIIATYRTNEGINSIILKGQGSNWEKAADIFHPGHESLNYRTAVKLADENKKHLLMGLSGGGGENTLYGYALSGETPVKLFSRDYSWFELVRKPKNSRDGAETLSFWNRSEDGHYDIEVMNWSGIQLESERDDMHYYRTRVAPYYLKKAKQDPSNVNGWYRLAEAFIKAGATRDAIIVADAGSKQNRDPLIKDKFLSLKRDLTGEG